MALFSCFLDLPLFAHEYVLLAYKYIVKEDETLELHLFVADGFNIELERPFQQKITKSLQLITGSEHHRSVTGNA